MDPYIFKIPFLSIAVLSSVFLFLTSEHGKILWAFFKDHKWEKTKKYWDMYVKQRRPKEIG